MQEGKTSPLPPWMLTLRDPADETNDLGRKAIAWKHIQMTYSDLAKQMEKDMTRNNRASLLVRHVGPIYALQQAHRNRLKTYGETVAAEGKKSPSVGNDINERYRRVELQRPDEPTKETKETDVKRIVDLSELASIAQAIRKGELADAQSARETEALDMAKEAAKSGEDGVNPWLKDVVGDSEHKETGEALSNLLGLDKKREMNK